MKRTGLFGSVWVDATVVGTPLAVAIAPITFVILGRSPKDSTKSQVEAHLFSVGEAVYANASIVSAIAGLVGLFLMALAHDRSIVVDGIGKLIALWGACSAVTSLTLEHLNSTAALPVLVVSSNVFNICFIVLVIICIAIIVRLLFIWRSVIRSQ